jgi:uncharacterized CHY-type Zn-finger protein
MNPYEECELENRDLYCDMCGQQISVREYMDNESFCDSCIEEEANETH